ncbi:glycosyltransferase [Bacteroides sp.]
MNIFFVGLSGVPYSSRACDVRLCAFANLFVKKHSVTILNRFSSKTNRANNQLADSVDVREVVEKKGASGILRILLFIWSVLKEPFLILILNHKNKIDVLHVYTGHFLDFLVYKFIGSCIKAKVIYQYVELRSAKPRRTIYHKLNAYFCDNFGAKYWDASICISNYLEEKAKNVSKDIPTIKVTPICDFSFFEGIEAKKIDEPYLLFCGSAAYFEVVQLVISSYRTSKINQQASLKLVLSGKDTKLNEIKQQYPDLEILSNLDYKELIAYYKGAIGLFIPLRDTLEDIARFPNKICEYLASYGLIITTQTGEVPYYFEDKKTAVIASVFNVESVVENLDWIADNTDKIESIKERAYQVGLSYFDLKANENRLEDFLQKVCRK